MGKVQPILMPQAGQSMEEGTIIQWRVQEGERIQPGQVILEIETDKTLMEVESDQAGRLAKILSRDGDIVAVKTPIAYLAETDEELEAFLSGEAKTEVAAAPASPEKSAIENHTPKTEQTTVVAAAPAAKKASPAARKIAKELKVDLESVKDGSGPRGRILSDDVKNVAGPAGSPHRRPISRMRQAIARNLLASKQNIPHFYVRQTVEADSLLRFHQSSKAQFPCSLNDVMILACAKAMAEFPDFRSYLDGDEIVTLPDANIGVAVSLDEGLIVPTLAGADRLSLPDLARESRRIVERARQGVLDAGVRSTFTISNLGMFGVEEFTAIINPSDVAILAVGGIRESVIVKGGAIRPARVVGLTLSCDHRVIDGVAAAKFMARLKEILEGLADS